jgi:hypothetical protein
MAKIRADFPAGILCPIGVHVPDMPKVTVREFGNFKWLRRSFWDCAEIGGGR